MTKEQVKKIFQYKDGFLFWKDTYGQKSEIAGHIEKRGYTNISINGKKYRAHRLIWTYHNGKIPSGLVVDHIDCDKTNNKIENLRLNTYSGNAINTKRKTGVRKHSSADKWQSYMTINGRYNHLGNYQTRREAEEARSVQELAYEHMQAELWLNYGRINND